MEINKGLYEGFKILVEVSRRPNKKYNDSGSKLYMKIKEMFRYPGEMLERFQEKGYTSVDDIFTLLRALYSMREMLDESMFVGDQKRNFLQKAMEAAGTNGDPEVYFYLFQLSGDKASRESLKEKMVESMRSCGIAGYLKYLRIMDSEAVEICLNGRPELPESIHGKLPIKENLDTYIILLELSVQYVNDTDVCKEWRDFFKAFRNLYTMHVKEDSPQSRRLEKYGFSYLECLDLNCGLFESGMSIKKCVKEKDGRNVDSLRASSDIKYWRLRRSWVHYRLLADEEVPDWIFRIFLEYTDRNEMPRNIDGTNKKKVFLFYSLSARRIKVVQNAYKFFELCNKDNGTWRTTVNVQLTRQSHNLSVSDESGKKFIEGLLVYIDNRCAEECSAKEIRNRLFLETCINEWEKLQEKADFAIFPTIEKVFQTDRDVLLTEAYRNVQSLGKIVYSLVDTGCLSVRQLDDKGMWNNKLLNTYLSKCRSVYAYDYLMELWDKKEIGESGWHQMKGKVPTWMLNPEDERFNLFSDEQVRKLAELVLECSFRNITECSYEETLVRFLADAKIRKVFPGKEAMGAYRALSADPGDTVCSLVRRYNLDHIFLEKEELEKKARDEQERARKEKEERVRKKEEKIIKEYTVSFSDEDTVGDKIEKLARKRFDWEDKEHKLWLKTMEAFLPEGDITLSKKGIVDFVDKYMVLYNLGTVSLEGAVSIIQRLKEKEEKENA